MKVLVVFYSMYGHIYKMAQAIAEGAKEVPGAEVVLRQGSRDALRRGPREDGRPGGAEGHGKHPGLHSR